jgi:hypothetical protein
MAVNFAQAIELAAGVKPEFREDTFRRLLPKVKSGAPFPFNKLIPYDAVGGEHLNHPYKQSAWVQRAIKKIAGPISAVDLNFTLGEEAFNDPILDAFWANPAIDGSGRMTRADFVEASIGWLKLEGEFFWIMDDTWLGPFPNASRVSPLIIARPDHMRHIVNNSQIIGWDYVDAGGKHIALLPEQVIHCKMWNPYDPFRGCSEMHAAKDAAEGDFMAGKFNKNLMANNGDQGVFIVAKGGMPDDTQRQMMIDMIREKRELAQRGQFRAAFLVGDVEVQDPKIHVPDAAFIAVRLENRHEIYMAFGVPPSMADVQASYSIGSASDWFMLITETCIPSGGKLCNAIDRAARLQTGKDVRSAFNWNEHPVMQAVRRERTDTAQKYFQMGVPMDKVNEYLGLGLPKYTGWERGYLPATLVPVQEELPPPPEDDPTLEEPTGDDDVALMLKALDPLEGMRRALAAPKPLALLALNGCCSRAVKDGLLVRVATPKEMAQWRALQLQRSATRRAYIAKIGKVLFEARAEVLAKLEARQKSIETKSVASDLMFDLHDFTSKLFASIRPVTENALQSAGSELFEEVGLNPSDFSYSPEAALQFVKERELKLKNVPQEISDGVRDTIEDSLENGDSIADTADAVRAKFNEISKGRATAIATTETGVAYESARDKAMKAARIGWKKWLTSGNANVRPTHAEADGQIVAVTQPFEVGGEELRFPCDPLGSPGEVINCHCVSVPSTKGPTA